MTTTTTTTPEMDLTKLVKKVPLKGLKDDQGWPAKVTGWQLGPKTAPQVAALLQQAAENGQTVAFSQQSATELYTLGKQPVWLDFTKLKAVRWHRPGDLTVMVESGMTVGDLQALLAPHGQHLPLTYPPDAKLIDLLAVDTPPFEAGTLGYLKDWVLGLEVAHPNGTISKCGAQVVKNATGYDLNKLYIGSHHQFGVITAVILKLQVVPPVTQSWWLTFNDLPSALSTYQRLCQASPVPLQQALLVSGNRIDLYKWPTIAQVKQRPLKRPWALLIQSVGTSALLEPLIQAIQQPDPAMSSVLALDDDTAANLQAHLMHWTDETVVAEVALPVGVLTQPDTQTTWQPLISALGAHAHSQAILSAGVFTWAWPGSATTRTMGEPLGDADTAQSYLASVWQAVAVLGGQLQIQQVPLGWTHLFEAWNGHADPILLTLAQRLQAEFDPQTTFFVPQRPMVASALPEGAV